MYCRYARCTNRYVYSILREKDLANNLQAAAIVTLLFAMSLTFNGVMQSPTALPGFWIFMYRVSPFTYWIGGIVAAQLHGKVIECSQAELSVFNPPAGQTCGQYLADYLRVAPGTLQSRSVPRRLQHLLQSSVEEFRNLLGVYWIQYLRCRVPLLAFPCQLVQFLRSHGEDEGSSQARPQAYCQRRGGRKARERCKPLLERFCPQAF
jgi:hypothetical protein